MTNLVTWNLETLYKGLNSTLDPFHRKKKIKQRVSTGPEKQENRELGRTCVYHISTFHPSFNTPLNTISLSHVLHSCINLATP
ncbi:hypothetical protein RJT34_07211 [Clitoria ternatea]|uniref:Uncharacterized protein n=1 Tax=Clitoria ternatea TaxID=43366 RepID=A0AAN9K4V8_CLITE